MESYLAPLLSHNILYCEADSNYTIIHYHQGFKKVICKTLKVIEGHLASSSFLRIHHKYLVNKEALVAIDENKTSVTVSNGVKLLIARRRKKVLRLIDVKIST